MIGFQFTMDIIIFTFTFYIQYIHNISICNFNNFFFYLLANKLLQIVKCSINTFSYT